MSRSIIVAILAGAVFCPISSPAAEPTPNKDAALVQTAEGLLKNLHTATLENGLRIYLLPIKGSPVVSVMVAYRVGSADEEKDQTGLSHYLEHLMFKGTEKLMPGDIDRITQRNGGHNNAYTSEDMTVYHFDFAADRWHPALEIEADRMRNIRIDEKHEFEQEKGAVISELNGNEDQPGTLEEKAILPMLFPKDSPYSHPVIGEREHVKAATATIIKTHYDKWYHPNNASLVIVGGFDEADALARIKKLFGPIPKGNLPARKPPTFFKDRAGPVQKEFTSKFDSPRMLMGFNGVAVGSPEDPILDITQHILTDGRTSRLYRKLVEQEQIASSVEASNSAGRYPGWFAVSLDLFKDKDPRKAEEMVFAELSRLAEQPVSDEELNRARRRILAGRIFGWESVHGLANSIAQTSTYPGGENVEQFFKHYLDAILAVSKADIQRVAKEYLQRNRAVVVWSIPRPEKPADKPGAAEPKPEDKKPMRSPTGKPREPKALPEGGAGGFSLTAAQKVVLPNGLKLVMLEDHRLPIVVAAVEVPDVTLREPADKAGVAYLTGAMLDEGTARHTGDQIATLIGDTGGSMSLSAGGGSLKVLTPDSEMALGLMFECLTQSSFPEKPFERMKAQQLAAIDEADSQPSTRASQLFESIVYGKHPYGRPSHGTKETVEKLTAADCKAFHKQVFAPNATTVVIVGDIDAASIRKQVEKLTADWPRSDLGPPEVPAPPKPTGPTTRIISDPTAAQVHVFIGEIGVKRTDPDYYKLLVMDNVLGTGPGFTDRLSSNLRDRQGLAYTVRATITSTASNQPGVFEGYIGTFAEKFLLVRDGFLKEVNGLLAEPPTKQEVEDAKQYLLGSLPFRFTTLSGVASQLLAAERYGLGFDFLETYRKEVSAVTPADVHAAARKHLDPKTLTLVAVGAIDQDGKPLKKQK
jgi:zinc protease